MECLFGVRPLPARFCLSSLHERHAKSHAKSEANHLDMRKTGPGMRPGRIFCTSDGSADVAAV
ncbi:hypothetical protein AA309_02570 [Microvirga vignae]|uniref:Uncharacterized protein n=1 Tax=Microvirga vignae TaxID=1225564 RepID=A0A0H1RPN2_9HYPH|nr:hypothetical protein AA309_02570 [Microvirga vignae]